PGRRRWRRWSPRSSLLARSGGAAGARPGRCRPPRGCRARPSPPAGRLTRDKVYAVGLGRRSATAFAAGAGPSVTAADAYTDFHLVAEGVERLEDGAVGRGDLLGRRPALGRARERGGV